MQAARFSAMTVPVSPALPLLRLASKLSRQTRSFRRHASTTRVIVGRGTGVFCGTMKPWQVRAVRSCLHCEGSTK